MKRREVISSRGYASIARIVFPDDETRGWALARLNPYDSVTSDLYEQWDQIARVRLTRQVDGVVAGTRLEAVPLAGDVVRRRSHLAATVAGLDRRLGGVLAVAPAGAHADAGAVSAQGLRHGVSNLPELLLPNRALRPVELAGKLLSPLFHPDRTPDGPERFLAEVYHRAGLFNVGLNGGRAFHAEAVAWKVLAQGPGNTPQNPRLGSVLRTPDTRHLAELAGTLLPFPSVSPFPDARAASTLGAGFRCAR